MKPNQLKGKVKAKQVEWEIEAQKLLQDGNTDASRVYHQHAGYLDAFLEVFARPDETVFVLSSVLCEISIHFYVELSILVALEGSLKEGKREEWFYLIGVIREHTKIVGDWIDENVSVARK